MLPLALVSLYTVDFLLLLATVLFCRDGFESRWGHHIWSPHTPRQRAFFSTFPFPSYSVDKDLLRGVTVIPDMLAILLLDHLSREPHRSTIRLLLRQS
jgi:hypothetical protein